MTIEWRLGLTTHERNSAVAWFAIAAKDTIGTIEQSRDSALSQAIKVRSTTSIMSGPRGGSRVHDLDLDAAPSKKAGEPKSVAPSFVGQYHPSYLPARPYAPGLRALDKEPTCRRKRPARASNAAQLQAAEPP
jgi:hypothetical protein